MRRRIPRLARTAVAGLVMLAMVTAGAANISEISRPSVYVTIIADGSRRELKTTCETVKCVLDSAGMYLSSEDLVSPPLSSRVRNGVLIRVTRVREEVVEIKEPIPYETIKRFSLTIRPGKVMEIQSGEAGERVIRYRLRYEDGKLVSKTVLSTEITKQPSSRIVCIGSRGRYTSRGSFRTIRVLRMLATAYDPGPRSCGRYASGRTAIGLRAGYGVAAVDPCVIPLGTHLYVEGYGYAIAGDRGRAIKGNRIDLGFPTYTEARRFGCKMVTVHVLRRH